MTHKKWHFQIFVSRQYSPADEVLAFDSQTCRNEKVQKGFGNQLKAYREAEMYARLMYHKADANPVQRAKISTFTVAWSDLPGHHQVTRLLETVNALNDKGLPRITYPEQP
jgi:hypothetical protein